MAGQVKRTEFNQALKAIASERGLDADVILETIRQAYVAAFKRDAKDRGEDVDEEEYTAEIDSVTGEAKILHIADPEKPDDKKDVTPPGFGRIAAQTAKQVIHQKIREAEKGAIMDEFDGRVGELISGTVLRFDGSDVRVDLGRTEGIMPAAERIPSERLSPGQRVTFLLKDIKDTPRGKQIILSRAGNEFVKKVFMREVPEISSGSVEIKGISREAGVRTKIAVATTQPGVDPVGSCVGQKGVRVQSVTNELGGERIDIIPYSENEKEFIEATLAPVEVSEIELNDEEKTAKVTVPNDQLSLAIGKEGQNARLASKLTGYHIEVVGEEGDQAAEEKDAAGGQATPDEEGKNEGGQEDQAAEEKETAGGQEKTEDSEKKTEDSEKKTDPSSDGAETSK